VDPGSPVDGGHVPGLLTTPAVPPSSSGPIDVDVPVGPIVVPVIDSIVPVDGGHVPVIPADPMVPVDVLPHLVTPAAPVDPVVAVPLPADPVVVPPPADPAVVPPPVDAAPVTPAPDPATPVRPRQPLDTPATGPVTPVVLAPVTTPLFTPFAPVAPVLPTVAPATETPAAPAPSKDAGRPAKVLDDAGLMSLMAGPMIGRGGLLGMLALTLVDGSAGPLSALPMLSATGPAIAAAAGVVVSGVSVVAVATAQAAGQVAAGVDAASRSVRAPEAPVAPVDIPHSPSGISSVGASAFAPVPPPVAVAAILVLFMGLSLVRFGRVANAPARWRPVAFVSLLERPG
jgi:hypothetical protein